MESSDSGLSDLPDSTFILTYNSLTNTLRNWEGYNEPTNSWKEIPEKEQIWPRTYPPPIYKQL